MTKVNRRDFFKVAAVSGAAAAVAGCGSDPVEEIIPMLVPPTEYKPGVTISFASTCNECSANCGMVIRTREARAIKAEGNPHHPMSQGSLCNQGQASMQAMYSPSRSKGPNKKGAAIKWDEGLSELAAKMKEANRVLYIGRPQSGSLKKLLAETLAASGGGDALQFDMMPVSTLKKGNEIAFGTAEIPEYAIGEAKTLVTFGADILDSWLNNQLNMREFTRMHAYKHGEKGKFIHVSPHMSLTGANADQWVGVKPGDEALIALAVAGELLPSSAMSGNGALKSYLDGFTTDSVASKTGVSAQVIKGLAKDFNQGGMSLAMAGGNTAMSGEGTKLQVAVNLLNAVAGNLGKTVKFGADYKIGGDSAQSFADAAQKMKSGAYQVVLIEGANPVYALPKDSGFAEALAQVPLVVSLSTEEDETSALAHMHLPTSHSVEAWGDSMPRKGVYGLQQPAMAKLPGYDTMSLGDLMVALAGKLGAAAPADYKTYLMAQWKGYQKDLGLGGAFEDFWKKSLQQGGQFTGYSSKGANLQSGAYASAMAPKGGQTGLAIVAANSPNHRAEGTNGNRTWLLEIPHPITQLVWDSWVEISPDTAVRLGVNHFDEVEITTAKGSLKAGVWVNYGIADNVLSMPTGLGREVPFPTYVSTRNKSIFLPHVEMSSDIKIKPLKVGTNVMDLMGFDTDALSGDLQFVTAVSALKATGETAYMVTPEGQAHHHDAAALSKEYTKAYMGDRSQKGRGFAQSTSVEAMNGHGGHEGDGGHHLRHRHYTTDLPSNTDMYPERAADVAYHVDWSGRDKPVYYETNKWEMAVDLDRCTGCAACVVACYAENNVAVVGKERMSTGREMSWLRVARWQDHNEETGDLETYFSPNMCGQCANAGCETVCPVYATYHNDEGINAMVYNRCVGTRYCANNCIYKQRRFNWRTYEFPAPLHMQLNPAMTVREKGVMEKCNFCYSRIREGKDLAKDMGREVFDGEIKTACQQTCPADAISFGNIKDPKAKVTQIVNTTKRGYHQLEEVNFKPAVTYLKKINHDNKKA
ncbi:MAG: 4Fe-4S dicluster domain-containing protein [bacterium]|nr:4Fe-4S dicluster domain-containing protein [bacterium]